MKQPAALTVEEKRLQQNIANTTKTANDTFPNETWIDANTIKLNHIKLPDNADSILVAVTRLPRIKRVDGKVNLPGPDAIVNGLFFEFKTVTGKIKKVGKRFTESREQGENVYIRVDNPCHTKAGVLRCLVGTINHKD